LSKTINAALAAVLAATAICAKSPARRKPLAALLPLMDPTNMYQTSSAASAVASALVFAPAVSGR
ncbi:MAG: hypothetical protein K0Q77_2427, partial [Anaerosporomusa subterranea]|nr:hypothetical protein [Anaerosporomusa subterranea]